MTPAPLVVLAAQRPEAVQGRLTAALRAGRVPGRLLYDSAPQAARWLAYHRAWAPAGRAEAALAQLYDAAFTAAWAAGPATYVGLGCGGGAKDARFMALGPASHPAAYVAAGARRARVRAARDAVALARPDAARRGVVFDLLAAPARAELLGDLARPDATIWSALGLLPNVDAAVLLPLLGALAGPSDQVLVSANLSPAPYPDAVPRVLPQYDNPEARAWYAGALAELGLGPDDAPLSVGHRALTPDGAVWRVEATAILTRAVAVTVHAAEVALAAGTTLSVFHSDRYLPEAMPGVLAQHGLTMQGAWVAEDREEGTYLATVTGRRGPGASST